MPFLPQDGNFTSAGAIKAPDARPDRLGFQAFFLPTAVVDEQGPRSVFPDALNPALFSNVWYGPPKTETGRPENVYPGHPRTDPVEGRERRAGSAGTEGRRRRDAAGRKGSIQLDGWERWVKLQVGDTPGVTISLVALGFAVTGLCLSLFVRPDGSGCGCAVRAMAIVWWRSAGLDRADARAGLSEDLAELAEELSRPGGRSEKVGVA